MLTQHTAGYNGSRNHSNMSPSRAPSPFLEKEPPSAHKLEITNRDEVLGQVDQVIFQLREKNRQEEESEHHDPEEGEKSCNLSTPKPPAVEYLFVEPYGTFRIWGNWGFGINPYGHAAVRYTMPGTLEQKVVNISGTRRDNLVTFYTPEEYLFENTDTGDQGGIWNRNIVSVRIEEAEPWQIEDMDYYFRKLYRKNHLEQTAKFSIIFSPIYNLVRWLCSFSDIAVRGNCAYFTSSGLAEGGFMRMPTLWPKKIWMDMFEKQGGQRPDNVHVVYYQRIPNEEGLKYGVDVKSLLLTGVAPLSPMRSYLYRDLRQFADVVVEVPVGSYEAQVNRPHNPPKKPSSWRYQAGTVLLGLGVISLFALSRTSRRKVQQQVNHTQANLKYAKELVSLFQKHRREIKQAARDADPPKSNKSQ